MLYTTKVVIKWNRSTCTYFKKLGYQFTKIGDEFEVKVEDLTEGTHTEIECICDYCLQKGKETLIKKPYRDYLKSRKIIAKDCCFRCQGIKEKECNLKKYGVTSTALIPEIKEKQKQTMIKNYGVENAGYSKEIREKIEKTNLEKYGFKNAMQNSEIREKANQTCLDKYGVKNYNQTEEGKEKHRITNLKKYGSTTHMHNKEIIDKIEKTCLEKYGYKTVLLNPRIKEQIKETTLQKYGVEHNSQSNIIKQKKIDTYLKNWGVTHPMKNKEYCEQIQIKLRCTMYRNKSGQCSNQQEYLWSLIGGELNYPINRCSLDIAFPSEKIYIEYNGGGHNLGVKMGQLSEEEFRIKESKRYYFLKSEKWKLIKIISTKDLLPQDDILIKIINEAKEYLNTGHSWIEYNIDEGKVKCSQYEKDYDFGELRKIYKKDLKIS